VRDEPLPQEKSCPQCRKKGQDHLKPLSEFYHFKSGKNAGKPYCWCKDCVRDNERRRHREGRRKPKPKAEPLSCYFCGESTPRGSGVIPRYPTCITCRADPDRETPCDDCGVKRPRSEFTADSFICKECRRKWYQSVGREQWVMRYFGITYEQKQMMFNVQQGLCGSCFRPLPPMGTPVREPDVDHNHERGWVRALLCRGCNTSEGNLPGWLDAALLASYKYHDGIYMGPVWITFDKTTYLVKGDGFPHGRTPARNADTTAAVDAQSPGGDAGGAGAAHEVV
jgi:Recombination endonuclease VII.